MGLKNEHVHGKKDVARINERNAKGASASVGVASVGLYGSSLGVVSSAS